MHLHFQLAIHIMGSSAGRKLNMDRFSAMSVFVRVVEAGNFTRAAGDHGKAKADGHSGYPEHSRLQWPASDLKGSAMSTESVYSTPGFELRFRSLYRKGSVYETAARLFRERSFDGVGTEE